QIVLEVSEILRCRGFRVESGIAEEMLVSPDRLASTHDLYLLKSYTALSLSLAGVLHAEGARLLNPYPGCFASRDKIVASKLLHHRLRCGRAFGLGLYSMDVIGTPDGPKVVDVNDFPGYKAVPDAAVAVADYIERFATRWCSLQPPEMVVPNGTATHTADQ